ncbi:hypothetical protein CU048_12920 [Beijerinckiaceae bacterium]|nr:hypothetical protein CU048_12920 [Beijerinckiaceae bacterium]
MADRGGNRGGNGNAVAFPRKSFLIGLSLLTIAAFLDVQPAAAQYLGIGPFGVYLGGGGHYRRGYSGHRYRRHSYRSVRHHSSHARRHGGGGHRHHDGGGGAPVPKI